ncbi:hypothetical protein BBK36DRAFT_1163109 [Trichoderma citrinoviride]|uniref:Uncharacterized protein n=1 Tax=Trichoderma citrinoviride TaxID=58853 RepID=A0A2T4AZL3_9HYPO|nr:hypothetical protein BBK36DRAFT_1163109 [Trichoderma citrinoviride]PTB62428.1 hypothetical protein BBK36DRAFT_1163109 [Trichoderma citrinoviride]
MLNLPQTTPECLFVGEGRSDLVGIGIIVGFVGQATISLCLALWAFFFSTSGFLDGHHHPDSVEFEIEQKRLECVSDILMVGNDIQMVIGTSYMISVFSSAGTISTYHLHLAFDIVSFVGVSSAAALVCWTYCTLRLHQTSSSSPDYASHLLSRHIPCLRSVHFTPRHRGTYLFAALYLVLTILLGLSLDAWNPDAQPGRCYLAHLVTHPQASHPAADKVYVAFTAAWMLLVMLAAALSSARWRHSILALAFLQFPVHLYMALALRAANQGHLEGDDARENRWDFGQTTAVVLLAMAARELFDKGTEFYFFERELRKRGALLPSNSNNSNGSSSKRMKKSRDGRNNGDYCHSRELRGVSGVGA